ncbi:MAG: glycosyltransferase [Thermomicrobiales bacterium]|nr:glycosyltransferase [Thermomicrobiales bacterium]
MRVALIHDYLTQYGGAERVLEVLHSMYPDAPVYSSLYEPNHLPPALQDWEIHTSPIARIPGASMTHRLWTPLYPLIFRQIGRSLPEDLDVVIADSSAFSHQAAPKSPDIPLISYCHSPARFLYGDRDYLGASKLGILRPVANSVFGLMRAQDQKAARRVTQFVANSNAVRDRIRDVYDRDAEVIYPPIDIERFRPDDGVVPEDWYLVVSRLVPHKWIDRAVRAATKANVPLKVIGSGRSEAELRAMAGSGVEFLGELPDTEVVWHMQRSKALILPGIEDFGMTAVETQAAGRPVLAARGGGALETVIDGETGWHFGIENDEELIALLRRNDIWDTNRIQSHAAGFSQEKFETKMDALINRVVSTR